MEWWSAPDAVSCWPWRPPTSAAEASASPSRVAADLPPFLPIESDLNVLLSAVDSVAALHYDARGPPPPPSSTATPAHSLAAAPDARVPPLYWDNAHVAAVGACEHWELPVLQAEPPPLTSLPSFKAPLQATSALRTKTEAKTEAPRASPEPLATPKRRQCSVPDCPKTVQSRGRCVRHGGGKRCPVEGCWRGAQANGKCKTHGGGVRCSVDGCGKASQGGGRCRGHGGGKLCEFPGCTKGAQRKSKCAGHQGASVCSAIGCAQPAQDRGGFCSSHKRQ